MIRVEGSKFRCSLVDGLSLPNLLKLALAYGPVDNDAVVGSLSKNSLGYLDLQRQPFLVYYCCVLVLCMYVLAPCFFSSEHPMRTERAYLRTLSDSSSSVGKDILVFSDSKRNFCFRLSHCCPTKRCGSLPPNTEMLV